MTTPVQRRRVVVPADPVPAPSSSPAATTQGNEDSGAPASVAMRNPEPESAELEVPALGPLFQRSYRSGQSPEGTLHFDGAIGKPRYTNVFDRKERTEITRILGGGLERQELDPVVAMLDTPERVAAFVGKKFTWSSPDIGPKTLSPFEMLNSRKGVCRDQHTFATYVLQRHGIRALTVGYSAPDQLHAVTVYEAAPGQWNVLEYGRILETKAPSWEAALGRVAPGALMYRVYETTTNPNDRVGSASKLVYTEAGRNLLAFMHGEVGARSPGPMPPAGIERPLRLRAGESWFAADRSGVTASAPLGPLTLDTKLWLDQDPTLSNAAALALRAQLARGLAVSVGAIHMPNVVTRTIGDRENLEAHPLSLGFVSAQWSQGMWAIPVTEQLELRCDATLRGAGMLAFDHGRGQLDTGLGNMSHLDLVHATRARYDISEHLALWAASTSHLPLAAIVWHLTSDGSWQSGPWSHYFEAGVDVNAGRLSAQASAYFPTHAHSNLFADHPRWQAAASYRLGADLFLLGYAYGPLSKDPAVADTLTAQGGILSRGLSVTAGVEDSSPAFFLHWRPFGFF